MPAPYNYVPNVPMPDVSQSLASLGKGISDAYAYAQAEREKQRQLEKQAILQAQMNADLVALKSNPTPENVLTFRTKYPQMAKEVQDFFNVKTEQTKQAQFQSIFPIFSALEMNDAEAAKAQAQLRIDALTEAGFTDQAKLLKSYSDVIDKDPQRAKLGLGMLAASIDPAKFQENLPAILKAKSGADLSEAEAAKKKEEALQAAIDTKLYEQGKLADIGLKQAQIEHYAVMDDIAREGRRIQWAELQLAKAKSEDDRAKWLAELDAANNKRNQIVADKKAEFDKANIVFDDTIALIKKIKDTPLEVRERAHGPMDAASIAAMPFAMRQSTADYLNLLDTMRAKNFSAAAKSVGSMAGLSEKEGAKLEASQGSINNVQSVKSLDRTLGEIESTIGRVSKVLTENLGAYSPKKKQGAVPYAPGAAVAPGEEANLNVDY